MDLPGRFLNWTTFRQLVKYGIVGIAQNSVGYAIYLFFTWLGADPKLVVGISYPIAMLVSFAGNKKYTFKVRGHFASSGVRFIIAHIISYGINLAMLYILVDKMGYRHEYVQAAAIFVCAAFLFLALKFFVFPGGSSNPPPPKNAAPVKQ